MLAMQYTINLPHGFDMQQIHARVEERIRLFESLPGLKLKSYLINEEERIYAPFYVWENIQEAREFMLNDLFRGVVQSFTRPRIRNWTVLERRHGEFKGRPTHAVREMDSIPLEEDLQSVMSRETLRQEKLLENPNLYYHLIALDPDRWEIMRFSLWKDLASKMKQPSDVAQSYYVAHVSEQD